VSPPPLLNLTTSLRSSENGHLPWVKQSRALVSSVAGALLSLSFLVILSMNINDETKILTMLYDSWITRLHTTFIENGLHSVSVDRRKFAPEIATLLLDTWMMASQEISTNVLDRLGEGRGDVARGLIEEVGRNRGNTAFNLERVVTVGRKGE